MVQNNDIVDLLTELRVYLGETLAREKLSGVAEAQRLRLLTRLRCRGKSPSPPHYLDMTNSNGKGTERQISDQSYETMQLPPCSLPVYCNTMPDVILEKPSPGGDVLVSVSASAIRHSALQSGPLSRPERYFWFIGQNKKYWAALGRDRALYLYPNDKETSKPSIRLDLSGYLARPIKLPTGCDKKEEKTKKDNTAFEVVCPGKKTYQFIAPTPKELDLWVSSISEHCKDIESDDSSEHSKSSLSTSSDISKYRLSCAELSKMSTLPRQLPSVPPQETYDIPDSRVRPVYPTDYEIMAQSNQDDLYHCIDDKSQLQPSLEQLYKNVAIISNDTETTYYNVLPSRVTPVRETEPLIEEIYHTIAENKSCSDSDLISTENITNSTNNKPNTLHRYSSGRVQAIVQQMEGKEIQLHLLQPGIQLYEPVNASQEHLDRCAR